MPVEATELLARLRGGTTPPAVAIAPDFSTVALSDGEHTVSAAATGESFWREFFREDRPKIGFNIKNILRHAADCRWLATDAELPLGGFVFDAALAAYLTDEKQTVPELPAEPEAAAAALAVLSGQQNAALDECKLRELFETIELPLAAVLADMEHTGFAMDRAGLTAFGATLSDELSALSAAIRTLAGVEINLNSPKQLGVLLFETLGLPGGRKTKSGYSTDVEVLTKIADRHPIVPALLRHRQLSKLVSTYVNGLLREIAADGRIHTTFQMTATATGRLSSTEPNLQNIPIRSEPGSELRRFFIAAPPGSQLVDADYSQIELRLLAAIAGDRAMLAAFQNGVDIHTATAAEVFKVAPEGVTPELRRRAKAVNFGIVYGISAFALAADLGVSRAEAQGYIDCYFATYPEVAAYLRAVVAQARERGYVETLFHRRRYLPELKSANFAVRSFGERVAQNMPIQGSAADVIKIAMINVFKRLRREGHTAKLILQIHDELMIEAPADEVVAIKKLLSREMANAVNLPVPLQAAASCGENWLAAQKAPAERADG